MDGRAHNVSAVLRLLLGFVVLSTIAGLLMAGLAIPAVGATGQIAKGGVGVFNDLPSEFTISPLAQQSRILDANGKIIANPYDENRIIVPLEKISKHMQNAQLAIEDSRFYQHNGLDVRGFSRAMVSNLQGGDTQGASTLTQQFVKISLQDRALRAGDEAAASAAIEKSYSRKLQELKYALNVEENFTKDQILEGYLNLVYYGDQTYGVQAAAQNYFGVSAEKLDIGQAALLAGIVQQPTAYNPVTNPKDAQARRNAVLDRMLALGMASAEEVAAAKSVEVQKVIKKKPVKGVCHRSPQPYFCAYVMEWMQKSPQMAVLGKTPAERLKTINQGGLVIRTTLDPEMQASAQKELTKAVAINNKQNLAGAVSMIEPGTGKVLAMAQATDFASNQTNLNVDQVYGGGPNGYQIGSTAKTFALVEALERGMPLNATINIPASSPSKPAVFDHKSMVDECAANQPWPVKNDFAQAAGPMSLREGVTKSVNPFFAALNVRLGACSVRDTMVKMGLHRADGKPISDTIAGIALGAGESTPMSVASAYATLAANGKYCEPQPVTAISTPDRKALTIPAPKCTQAISADVAAGVNDLLQSVVTDGTVAPLWDSKARPAAGKTGTTEKHNQIWFAGFTPQISTVVWVGNLKPASSSGNLYTLRGKCFGSYGCPNRVYGSTVAAPIWSKIMKTAHQGMPVQAFKKPSSAIRDGNYVRLPSVIGRSPDTAIERLKAAGFSGYVAGRTNSSLPQGTVAFTDPAGSALAGGRVGLWLSNGYTPPAPSRQKAPDPAPEEATAPAPAPRDTKPGKPNPKPSGT
jgi:membrane peptidoglycan carboxypeptidase